MKGKYLIAGILVLVLLIGSSIGVFGQELYSIPAAATNVKYGGTLKYISPQGPLALNFNPFAPAALPTAGLIYEPLFYVNPLTGRITPLLGTSYKWEDNNLKLVITTRSGVTWSDGVPFTASDVAFTFNYIKQYPALDLGGQWSPVNELESVEASGSNIVIFSFKTPDIPDFYNTIAGQEIVPEHIWSTINAPLQFRNENPVGTGPFLFKSLNPQTNTVIYTKNPNFWMKGLPYIDEFQYTSVSSNQYGLLVMLKHEADFSWIGMTDPAKTWIAPDPEDNHGFFPAVSYNYLFINTQNPPLDNPTVRKAIELAIDKQSINEKAYFNIAGVANAAGIIPTQLKEWFDPTLATLAASLSTYNPNEALNLLESLGYKKNASGILVGPDGKPFPTLIIPVVSGWNDYVTTSNIISQDLRKIGIPSIVEQTTPGNASLDLLSGKYDLYFSWNIAAPTPYGWYNLYLNPAFSAPKGENVISDYSRYTNPLVTAALKVYESTTDPRLQKQAMYVIERIMLEDVPYIPVVGAPAWNAYSTKYFVGWPSESDPYCALTTPGYGGEELLFLQVHLK